MLSYTTSLEVYDTIYFMVFFSLLVSALLFYIIIKSFNKHIAILSLPLLIFLFTKKFYMTITFGQWQLYLGTLFLIGVFWVMNRLELKGSFILLAIFMSATFLAHVVEFYWAVGFIAFYLLIKIIKKEFNLSMIKKITYAAVLTAILILNYFSLFAVTFLPGRSSSMFKISSIDQMLKNYNPLFTDFGYIVIILILVGFAISLFFLKKKQNTALIAATFMFIMGFSYIIGFDKSLQMRALWPIYLSVFFALAIYILLKTVIKWKTLYSIILSIILLFTLTHFFYEKISSPGLMDEYHWQAFNWVAEKIPEGSDILAGYNDPFYDQTSRVYNMKRTSYKITKEDVISSIETGTLNREVEAYVSACDTLLGKLAYKKGLFSYGFHVEEGYEQKQTKDICKQDYYIFDIIPDVSRQPAFIQFNIALRQKLLEKDFIQEVFNNQLVSILQNQKAGDECLA